MTVTAFRPPVTPALVIDRAALMHNLRTMQAACDAAAIRLRPHGKMHKCAALGRLQVEQGAVGLCCQTVGEAEAFARGGIADLLVSAPVPRWGPPRLARTVGETGARIAAVCDSAAQIEALGAAARDAGVELGCLIDVDTGMHRVGCPPDEVPELAALAAHTSGLRYEGIQAYSGDLQHLSEDRSGRNAARTATVAGVVAALRARNLAPGVVTGGGTGTYALDLADGVFNELQCGSYAVMDAEYRNCGAPEGEWPFHAALFIVTSVVSDRPDAHVTVDAGLKASSIETFPRVVAGAAEGSSWRPLGDEHGAIVAPEGANGRPREGDLVWLQPGHCDPTINLYDGFWVVDGAGAAEFWPIDARRASA